MFLYCAAMLLGAGPEPGVMPNPAAPPVMVAAPARPRAMVAAPVYYQPAPEVRAYQPFPAGVPSVGLSAGWNLTAGPTRPLVQRASDNPDHDCPNCGARQTDRYESRRNGSHAHKCPNPNCGTVWWHGGPLGYRFR